MNEHLTTMLTKLLQHWHTLPEAPCPAVQGGYHVLQFGEYWYEELGGTMHESFSVLGIEEYWEAALLALLCRNMYEYFRDEPPQEVLYDMLIEVGIESLDLDAWIADAVLERWSTLTTNQQINIFCLAETSREARLNPTLSANEEPFTERPFHLGEMT